MIRQASRDVTISVATVEYSLYRNTAKLQLCTSGPSQIVFKQLLLTQRKTKNIWDETCAWSRDTRDRSVAVVFS